MHRSMIVLTVLTFLILAAAVPAMASTPGSYIDWGTAVSATGESLECLNALLPVPGSMDPGWWYYDFGIDYGSGRTIVNLGLTIRSKNSLLFLHPYTGAGLSCGFINAQIWDARPYMLLGGDLLCFFWEQELVLAGEGLFGIDSIKRTGIRIKF